MPETLTNEQLAKFEDYSVCQCGAITLYTEDGTTYSVQRKHLKKYVPGIDLLRIRKLKQESYSCDWCVNHYGLDLCGCGSGEPFGKCDNGFKECDRPMQKLFGYSRVKGADAWL